MPFTVLIVDDDAGFRRVARRLLTMRGFVVVDDVPRRDQPDAGPVEAALDELLHELRPRPGGHEHEETVRLRVGAPLEEG